jgi:ABC-type transport system involved in multi-copper enzyme maturation permease subunit
MADLFILKTSLLEALKPKRLATALLMLLLPALAAIVWRAVTPGDRFDPAEAYNTLAAYFVFGFTLTILSVIYGTGALSAEIEGRTIVYLLTRPIPRWRLLLMKLIGAWAGITVTVSLSVILLGFAVYGMKPEWGRIVSDLKIIPLLALSLFRNPDEQAPDLGATLRLWLGKYRGPLSQWLCPALRALLLACAGSASQRSRWGERGRRGCL